MVPPAEVHFNELHSRLLQGTEHGWHWWQWHFRAQARGLEAPFVRALITTLLEIDTAMPGYAARTADDIVALGGRERHKPHYEQLLQRLAEIHVARQVVSAPWPDGSTFADEPVAADSDRNPELVVSTPNLRLGVEVKAPALLAHEEKRGSRPLQAGGRVFPATRLDRMAGGKEKLTLPRDNPVKDFLASADGKFIGFRAVDDDFYGVLAIVWDDFIYEPITALLHPASGLLTENSFARDEKDEPLRFPHVDAILLISHLQYVKRALGEDGDRQPFRFSADPFRWDLDPARPVGVINTPDGRSLPDWVCNVLAVRALESIPSSEYQPSDLVQWIDVDDSPET